MLLLVQPWQDSHNSIVLIVCVAFVAAFANITVADIVTDWVCVWAAALELGGRSVVSKVSNVRARKAVAAAPVHLAHVPVRRVKPTDFLVIYCLKSKVPDDIVEVLAFLHTSARLNQGSKATWLVLSGTQAPELAKAERDAVDAFNAQHGGKPRVRLVRRTRGILHKYGQYLDFIMLLNGHKKPVIYPDNKPAHPTGEIFEPCADVDFFYGADYEYLVCPISCCRVPMYARSQLCGCSSLATRHSSVDKHAH